jgi:CheY-like chemotaxis protein
MKPSQLIFYLDDNLNDLQIFKNIIEGLGHTVSLFTDGHEMLNILYFQNLKPDVIFLNIHMPILNGEEVLSIIKNSGQWKHIPVVMVSGAYPKKLARHLLEIGANYLMKRPHLNDYKNEIEQALNINF